MYRLVGYEIKIICLKIQIQIYGTTLFSGNISGNIEKKRKKEKWNNNNNNKKWNEMNNEMINNDNVNNKRRQMNINENYDDTNTVLFFL